MATKRAVRLLGIVQERGELTSDGKIVLLSTQLDIELEWHIKLDRVEFESALIIIELLSIFISRDRSSSSSSCGGLCRVQARVRHYSSSTRLDFTPSHKVQVCVLLTTKI